MAALSTELPAGLGVLRGKARVADLWYNPRNKEAPNMTRLLRIGLGLGWGMLLAAGSLPDYDAEQ